MTTPIYDKSLPTSSFLKKIRPWHAFWGILVVSFITYTGLMAIIYGVKEPSSNVQWVRFFPWSNTFLNSLSTILLLVGYRKIRMRNYRKHALFMLSAFICSSLFLTSYIIYHGLHGDTSFTKEGIIRIVYFVILISHIILSASIIPGSLGLFYSALSQRWSIHRKLACWILPTWIYVSISGVTIFIFLYT